MGLNLKEGLYVETDEHPFQSQTFSNSGMSLVQHVNIDNPRYLCFTLRCGSFDLMSESLVKGRIYNKIKKMRIE